MIHRLGYARRSDWLKLEGFEPPTFGSGIRRAANCAIASQNVQSRTSVRYMNVYANIWLTHIENFLVRESNPGRQGENLVSWPSRLTRTDTYSHTLQWAQREWERARETGCDRDRTGDHRICNPMLYHWATHPYMVSGHQWNFVKLSSACYVINTT